MVDKISIYLTENEMDICGIIQTLSNSISAFIALLTLLLTFCTVVYAYKEFKKTQKDKRSEVFMQYNQRYEENPHIQKILKYCTIRDNKNENKPTVHDKEMFLRFYEELWRMIKVKYISEDDVCEFFAYYFVLLWNDDKHFFWDKDMLAPYKNLTDAHNSIEWRALNSLYNRMMKNHNTPDTSDHKFPNNTVK